jgi:hypothetical protein
MPMATPALSWTVQVPELSAQSFNLPLVSVLLSLRQFERFEQFFHILKGVLKAFDDLIDILYRLLNG